MANLTYLDLDTNNIGDPGLASLADACARGLLPKLEILNLDRNQIGDAGLSALALACASGNSGALASRKNRPRPFFW